MSKNIISCTLQTLKKRDAAISRAIYFYFDDSGVLHKNEQSGYFVYAGYVFLSREAVDDAKRKYICANKAIKKATGRIDELKASTLENTQKRSLYNSIKEFESLSAIVEIKRVYEHIMCNKKSICRYKDYILKRIIKSKLQEFVNSGQLNRNDDIDIFVYVDEQLTATNGYYDLQDSILEELRYGIRNFDYGVTHPNIFCGNIKVTVDYCESKKNYMIQAADILANRILASYRSGNPELRKIPNHTSLTFP